MHHCVLRSTHFSVGHREYWTKSSFGCRTQNWMFYENHKCQEKTASHNMQICFMNTAFITWFFCNFSNWSQKAIEFPYHFPPSFVLSYVVIFQFPRVAWCYVSCFFRWDNWQHCLSANDNLTFQLKLSFCMLSKQISSIGLFIISKMTETQQQRM